MPTVIGRINTASPSERVREARQAGIAVARFAQGFTRELRDSLVRELLVRLAIEKKRRAAQNLNHWEEYAKPRIYALAEQLLSERSARVAAYLKTHRSRLEGLAYRVTRDRTLADAALVKTIWEFWQGRTYEEVLDRALIMNARNHLETRATHTRRFASLDGMTAAAAARGESLDFPSQRLEDQDPLEILLAKEAQRETDDEMTYALQNVRCRGNRWIYQTEWWKSSGLAELESAMRGSDFGGSPE